MKFALFYEIPVARPWDEDSEFRAYQNTLEQGIFGDQCGWDAFWTVEHHFFEEFSHCSNPEVLYGALASRTKRMRLGFGVRLMPKPYNHPIRSAESAAVLDLLSDGRVDFATGRSATRIEMEGFGVDPGETREMWREALGHIVGAWTEEVYEMKGKHWQGPPRRVLPKPRQKPHPPVWGATTSDEGHAMMGELGIGLCSFAVGTPPAEVKRKLLVYREAIERCEKPVGAEIHNEASTFTMMCCAPTTDEAVESARESFEWYPGAGAKAIGAVADWMKEKGEGLGTYSYAADMKASDEKGELDLISMEYLRGADACVVGSPDDCLEACRKYADAGVDLLLCLVNPYKIEHEKVMQTIELMGKHVIPHFR
jgi:alkanesulfonate monooxygenase SsuD/methylene tetrahydromethanopterin reductase-like flavin-dependent oxidoreductase (luciferase family)